MISVAFNTSAAVLREWRDEIGMSRRCEDRRSVDNLRLQRLELFRNARSCPFEYALPILGPARANISAQESVPRRVGPCQELCFLTETPGSQITCLGMGGQAEQTASAPGKQTVSTTLNQTSGNGTWM